ncbi:glycosyltransferase family 4 protein [Methylocella silvestris]|uniref:Glycosyl transferase group 1 n=1 Tax=Methylocella silvestris TaxID=199596 RepID=A0A2J7TD87_METSI|nr:glycosyltransferase family 4 protein [Methylocella silvestris]PNG24736.1 hypothetical protein CR492_17195 [Methylocella silvestris]
MYDVTFICWDFDIGGAQKHTVELARSLREKANLAVGLIGISSASQTRMLSNEDLPHFVRLDRRGFGLAGMFLSLFARLRAHPSRLVVGVNQAATTAAFVSSKAGAHAGQTAGIFHTTDLRNSAEERAQLIHNVAMNRVNHLIFVSENQRRHWEKRGLHSSRQSVILNGVDVDRSACLQERARASIRREAGFADTDVVIGLCAKFREEKNHAQLVDAIAALRARGLPAKALFVGAGTTEAACRRHVDELGLGDACIFAGEHDDVTPFLAAMDVGVLCSTTVETLSLAALEMMAAGLPLVLSDLGGASEIVAEHQNGFLFPVGDTGRLVDRLDSIIRDDALRRDMARESRKIVKVKFRRDRMVNEYIRRFGEILKIDEAARGFSP